MAPLSRAGPFAVAVLLHGGVALGLPLFAPRAVPPRSPLHTELFDVDLTKPPPTPQPVPAPRPLTPDAPRTPVARSTSPAQAAPALAAAVLARRDAPDEPVDMTDSFVTEAAAAYAGGTTSPNATGGTLARGSNASDGLAIPTSRSPPPGPDRSRSATLSGAKEWHCPFPPEADTDQIDRAVVMLRVETDRLGSPTKVTVLKDPGHGFGGAARSCALQARWDPARNGEGKAVEGAAKISVRFDR